MVCIGINQQILSVTELFLTDIVKIVYTVGRKAKEGVGYVRRDGRGDA